MVRLIAVNWYPTLLIRITFQGTVVGPEVCDDLSLQLGGDLGCQGVGGAYTAGLGENFLPQNTAPQDIAAAVSVFNECNTKCPKAKIVAGGYRQDSPFFAHAGLG